MSNAVQGLVWDAAIPNAIAKVIAVKLADWADDDGASIYPSVPTIAQKRLATNPAIHLLELDNFWLNVMYPNWSTPPTDNLKFRQAVQAAVGFADIMQAASDGAWKPNPSLQYPGSTYYTETGKELLDQHDPQKVKQLLNEAGYHGEKVVLLTNKDSNVLRLWDLRKLREGLAPLGLDWDAEAYAAEDREAALAAVRQPLLPDAPNRDIPFQVAELFRDCFAAARAHHDRVHASDVRLKWTVRLAALALFVMSSTRLRTASNFRLRRSTRS